MERKTLVGITMGDPGGVGPEVILKALADPAITAQMMPVLIGVESIFRDYGKRLELQVAICRVESTKQIANIPSGAVALIEPPGLGVSSDWELGRVTAANGQLAYECITRAIDLALDGIVDALCTAPISKEAMFAAGHKFPGHTELLAERSGNVPVRMMLSGGGLKAVLQTIHVPLASVPSLLNNEEILESLRIMNSWGSRYLGTPPHIAVCGLNPHAGEGGHFGREEIEIIAPAINRAHSEGIRVTGPLSADTLFHAARNGSYDMVLAMYHDQALIPVKTLDLHGGVNTTLGLPFVRTSPDHGTAFDIAGKGIANAGSMTAALQSAAQLAVTAHRTK